MKAIVCEMCGSQEFAKQDGMYVCQHCKTKYDPEEAKKLMIEVSGSVKVDNSDLVQKSLQNARRAKQKEDWEETEKYYNLVEQNDPSNIEAIFYSSYAKARNSLIESDLHKREAAFNVLKKSVSIIDDNYTLEKEDEEKIIIENITNDFFAMTESKFTYDVNNQLLGINFEKCKTIEFFTELAYEFIESLLNIINKYPDSGKSKIEYLYQIALRLSDYSIKANTDGRLSKKYSDKKIQIEQEIKKMHPDYQVQTTSGGCYVATAVYGSYDCPQVWTLRRYRDYTLSETWYGRTFIKTYYAVSPTLVKWFGHTDWFRNMWKPRLDKMVKKLNNKGVKNTPYNDRKW